jgi:phosphatidylglycerophosphate synthase
VIAAAPRTLAAGLIAGFLLMLAFALDSADGQLARLQQVESRRGEWLDHMLDAATKLFLHLAVLAAWLRTGVTGWRLGVPIAFLVVSTLLFFAVTLGGLLRRLDGVTSENRPPLTGFGDNALRPLLQTPADHGAVCVVFLLWGLPSTFGIGYTVVLVAQTLFLGVFSIYWLKELS